MQVSASTGNRSRWQRFDTPLGSSLSVGTTADSKRIVWVFQIVFVVKRVISELAASVGDIDLGEKCPCEVGCPHLRRSEPPSSAKRGKREPSLSLQRGQNVFTLSNY